MRFTMGSPHFGAGMGNPKPVLALRRPGVESHEINVRTGSFSLLREQPNPAQCSHTFAECALHVLR